MSLTTGAPSVDLGQVFPELIPYARTTVRLHPRRGEPGTRDSHIGGPLLWPAGEAWPECTDRKSHGGAGEPYPMVPIAQLTAADVPEAGFPAGTDLLQILWCPEWHDQPHPEGWGQACRVFWRRAADVTDVLADQPDPEKHWDYEWDMIPRACVLQPERLVEYPWKEELPEDLRDRVATRPAESDLYDNGSAIPGYKVGGSMNWSVSDMPRSLACPSCEARLTLLLQLDTYEWALGAWGPDGEPHRFWPLEERHLERDDPAFDLARQAVGMTVGRAGHGGVFVCSADPAHPPCYFTQ